MKKRVVIIVVGFLCFNSGNAQQYFGKSYTATEKVDEYYDSSDVQKPFSVMGTTELAQGFRSLQKAQQKILELAKKKGANGVIFSMVDETYGTSNSSGVVINEKKNNKTTASSNSTSTVLKHKKIKATFVRYN